MPDHVVPLSPPQIEYISGGTPLTNQHYIASAKGEFYGMDHNITRLQAETITTLRPQTDVPNLYLTGTTIQTPCSRMRTPLGQQEMGEKTFSQTQGLSQEQLGDGWWLGMVSGGWGQ